jgi:hypothetical protein
LITYAFVNSKDWVKLQLAFFYPSTLSSVYYISMRFVVVTAAFHRIQVICVGAVSLWEWFPTFRMWVLRYFELSEPLTKRHSLISQKSLILLLAYM